MLSTNDILALSFGIASTVIGVLTALITYMRRAPEVPEDIERQITNEDLGITSHMSTRTPPPLNNELASHDPEMLPSAYDGTGDRAGTFHPSDIVDGGPPPYSNLPSPVSVTGINMPTIETLPDCLHEDNATHDVGTSLSTDNSLGAGCCNVLSSKSPRKIHTHDIEV